jgi:hypothetical protein
MYKVFFEPTYEEYKCIGTAATPEEALEFIYNYCAEHHYTPNISHWHKIDMPYREIIDVGTGVDYFSILNEDGGRVIFKTEMDKIYCNTPDCPCENCDMHISHRTDNSKLCDMTLWCRDYIDYCFGEIEVEEPKSFSFYDKVIMTLLILIGLGDCAIPLFLAIYCHNAWWLTLYFIIAVVLFLTCKFFKIAERGDFDDRTEQQEELNEN